MNSPLATRLGCCKAWVVAKLGLLQTLEGPHHLCMIDKKKLKGECCLGAITIYILRNITRIGCIENASSFMFFFSE